MLIHMFDAEFQPLEWQTRDGAYTDTIKAIELNNSDVLEDTIFVDDICDSGLTIQQIKGLIPSSQWAVLHSKKGNMNLDFEGRRLYNDNRWIVYPWEKK